MSRKPQARHGYARTPTYTSWLAMKQRCYRPSCNGYERYGGSGIRVCDRWLGSFQNFLADMGERPSLDHTLDRIDSTGHYEPQNCRWATRAEQAQNRRAARRPSKIVTVFGITAPMRRLLDVSWVPSMVVRRRIAHGWSLERAFSTPRNPPLLTLRGDNNAMRRPEVSARVAEKLRRRHQLGEITAPNVTVSDDVALSIYCAHGRLTSSQAASCFNTTVGIVNNIWSGRSHQRVTGARRINRRTGQVVGELEDV